MPQFIYTMKGLGKVHPPDLKVLEDIWLSFLPGAKIGVLGMNARRQAPCCESWRRRHDLSARPSGAGHDRRFSAAGAPPGPRQDRPRQRRGGCRGVRALLDKYDAINAKLGEDLSPEEMEKSWTSNHGFRTASTPPTRGSWTRTSSWRWMRCAFRPRTQTSARSRRRAPEGRVVPAPRFAGVVAPRRAHQPPRR